MSSALSLDARDSRAFRRLRSPRAALDRADVLANYRNVRNRRAASRIAHGIHLAKLS
jgi:hypothetical protein